MPVKPLKITTSLVLDSTTKSELEALPFPDGLADAPFPLQDTVNYTTVYERTNPWHGLTPKWQMKVSTGLTCNGGGTSLFKTGAFTHYVWASGDKIYIAGGTNIAAGWYTIVSRDNDDYITISAPCNTDATSHNDITFWELTPANMTFDNDGPPGDPAILDPQDYNPGQKTRGWAEMLHMDGEVTLEGAVHAYLRLHLDAMETNAPDGPPAAYTGDLFFDMESAKWHVPNATTLLQTDVEMQYFLWAWSDLALDVGDTGVTDGYSAMAYCIKRFWIATLDKARELWPDARYISIYDIFGYYVYEYSLNGTRAYFSSNDSYKDQYDNIEDNYAGYITDIMAHADCVNANAYYQLPEATDANSGTTMTYFKCVHHAKYLAEAAMGWGSTWGKPVITWVQPADHTGAVAWYTTRTLRDFYGHIMPWIRAGVDEILVWSNFNKNDTSWYSTGGTATTRMNAHKANLRNMFVGLTYAQQYRQHRSF